ncbi:hypothetical protein EMN47_00750 [Prolixibacteraceae bacterium JC049]|nr:hypothetical protein [Prolixibacteraceae bacterium JC049]
MKSFQKTLIKWIIFLILFSAIFLKQNQWNNLPVSSWLIIITTSLFFWVDFLFFQSRKRKLITYGIQNLESSPLPINDLVISLNSNREIEIRNDYFWAEKNNIDLSAPQEAIEKLHNYYLKLLKNNRELRSITPRTHRIILLDNNQEELLTLVLSQV